MRSTILLLKKLLEWRIKKRRPNKMFVLSIDEVAFFWPAKRQQKHHEERRRRSTTLKDKPTTQYYNREKSL